MLPYEYSKLNADAQEIRLVTLLPGKSSEPIQFMISHAPLVIPEERPPHKMSTEDLLETLPLNWVAFETLEGRYVFADLHEESEDTSWTHPDPSFDGALYEPDPELPNPGFQPVYEALSYTWGSTDNPETAYVVPSASLSLPSEPIAATIQIGQNLASALRNLRYRVEARVLWIDAVCINQNDITERSEQVQRMSTIYTLAHRVVIWLGPETGNSRLAISTLRHLGAQVESTRNYLCLQSPQCTEPGWYHSSCDLPYDEETWHGLHDLAQRSWFERLWVWQEIYLANSRAIVQCGHDQMPWTGFRRAVLCIHAKTHLPSPQFRDQFTLLRSLVQNRLRDSLSLLLRSARSQKCSEPKDKVYGLLGIAPPILASRIRPQYSLSVAAVYKDIFLVYLNQVQRLDLLQHCSLAGRQIDAPSWVPDWSVLRESGGFSSESHFASGISSAQAKYLPQDVLEVTGVQCATIRTVSRVIPHDVKDRLYTIWKSEPENLYTGSYVTGESMLDTYLSTLHLNRLTERLPVRARITLPVAKGIYLTNTPASRGTVDADSNNDESYDWLKGLTFVTTEEGYIGCAPAGAQPGKH